MRIYTGRGDEGKTDLWASDRRVSKSSARIEAYGSIDELNGLLGTCRAAADDDVADTLEWIQNLLHVAMADLADVEGVGDKEITPRHVRELEDEIDGYSEEIAELDGFILAGGSEAGSRLHHARSVCRRAERRVVALGDQEGVHSDLLTFINRLSDLIFVLGRVQNVRDGADETPVDYEV